MSNIDELEPPNVGALAGVPPNKDAADDCAGVPNVGAAAADDDPNPNDADAGVDDPNIVEAEDCAAGVAVPKPDGVLVPPKSDAPELCPAGVIVLAGEAPNRAADDATGVLNADAEEAVCAGVLNALEDAGVDAPNGVAF